MLLILGGAIVSLIKGSIPAFQAFGLGFFTNQVWNPVTEKFGAAAPIFGTIVTSAIAMAIAVPVGLGIAIFLTELCPPRLRRPIGIAIELLAGIPSIIYGIWGLFVFAPFLQQYVQPGLIALFGNVPVMSSLFAGPPLRHRHADRVADPRDHGPAVRHVDLARRVRHGAADAEGIGLRDRLHDLGSRPQYRHPVIPASASSAASCSDSAARSAKRWRSPSSSATPTRSIASLLAPGTTISASIANEFTEAVGDLYTSSLIALGLILFMITFVVLAIARFMLMRLEIKAGR